MDTKTQNKPLQTNVYAYTQHLQTIRVIEEACNTKIAVLTQDRSKDPVEDVLTQLPKAEVVLYAVLPIDKAVELKHKAPSLKLVLLQLEGKVIERLTGRPYDPKSEYPPDLVKAALKLIEVKGGWVKYMTFKEMVEEIVTSGSRKIAVFNDAMREAVKIALQSTVGVAGIEVVKTCDACVEINPLGVKAGYRISFPGTAGKLTAEQMAEMLMRGEARIYYVDIDAQEVPMCYA